MPADPAPHITSRRTLARGSRFDFEEATVSLPAGNVTRRQFVRHPGAVCILPLLERDRETAVVMIRNYRAAVDETVWEIPAGTLETNEDPASCAARELIEETGYRAATLTPLGRFHTSPGLTDERMWAFAATGLEHVGQRLEPDEHIEVRPLSVDQAFSLLDRNEMTDAKSMLTLLLGARAGLLASDRTETP